MRIQQLMNLEPGWCGSPCSNSFNQHTIATWSAGLLLGRYTHIVVRQLTPGFKEWWRQSLPLSRMVVDVCPPRVKDIHHSLERVMVAIPLHYMLYNTDCILNTASPLRSDGGNPLPLQRRRSLSSLKGGGGFLIQDIVYTT